MGNACCWYRYDHGWNESHANWAAHLGHLEEVRWFHSFGVYCTSHGANSAAKNGHFHVVKYLHEQGIDCTDFGANLAASEGHIKMVQYLRDLNIHCTSFGALWCVNRGQLETLLDLDAHGIYFPKDYSILFCRQIGRLHPDIVQFLRWKGMLPPEDC